MHPDLRAAYNQSFRSEHYAEVAAGVRALVGQDPTFRLCETPVFFSDDLARRLLRSADDISGVLAQPEVLDATAAAIHPPYWSVPGALERPMFLQYDFAICREGEDLVPWLIELQGFPSLYGFQADLVEAFLGERACVRGVVDGFRQKTSSRDAKLARGPQDAPRLDTYFGGLTQETYFEQLRRAILGAHEPHEVILLEIDPYQQNTVVDFLATRRHLGIPIVGLDELRRDGRQLFYESEGRRVDVRRIYNRVILDELLQHPDRHFDYDFREEVDVEWAGHPDWFLRISKHTLPALAHLGNVPETIFLSEYTPGSFDLEQYVLKPLFSFSGAGVNIHPTEADVAAVRHPANWILQRKVNYGPVLETPTGMAKVEVRMMALWLPEWPRARVVNNLVRVSKGEMTGVKYNKDKDWVGASVGLHSL